MRVDSSRPKLDELDRRILAALQLDPRASWAKLGHLAGTSETTVLRRVQRLREAGFVIVTALVDPQRGGLGQPVILHFNTSPDRRRALAEHLAKRPDVQYVALVTGRSDVMCELISPNSRHLAEVLMRELPEAGIFDSSRTAIVLKRFKTQDQWSRGILDDVDLSEFERDLVETDEANETLRPLDEVDTRILGAMASDGRRTYADISAEIGVSETVVSRHIHALVGRKQLSLVAMVDPATLGFDVEAIVHMRVDLSVLDETARAVAAMPETRYVSATSGDSDLIVDVVLKDTAAMYEFLSQRLGSLPGVRDIEINIVLESVKRGFQYPLFAPKPPDDEAGSVLPHPAAPATRAKNVTPTSVPRP